MSQTSISGEPRTLRGEIGSKPIHFQLIFGVISEEPLKDGQKLRQSRCSVHKLHSVGVPKMHPSQRPVLLGHNDPFHTNVGMSLPSIFEPSAMVGDIMLVYFNVLYSGRGRSPDFKSLQGLAGTRGRHGPPPVSISRRN